MYIAIDGEAVWYKLLSGNPLCIVGCVKSLWIRLCVLGRSVDAFCTLQEGGAGLKAHIVVERLPKLSSGSSVVSDNSSAAISGVNGSDSSEIISGSTMLNYYRHSQSFNCHLCTTKFKAYSQLRSEYEMPRVKCVNGPLQARTCKSFTSFIVHLIHFNSAFSQTTIRTLVFTI